MYTIMGITGRVGGSIAENLLAQGEQIRAIVRDPEKAARWRDRGAEIAVADVEDPNALASAFKMRRCGRCGTDSQELQWLGNALMQPRQKARLVSSCGLEFISAVTLEPIVAWQQWRV